MRYKIFTIILFLIPQIVFAKNSLEFDSKNNITSSREVNLIISSDKKAKTIAVSNADSFVYSNKTPLENKLSWDLCSRYGGVVKLPTCSDGEYSVFVMLYDDKGKEITMITNKITLKTDKTVGAENVGAQNLEPKQVETQNLVSLKKAKIEFKKDLKIGITNDDVKRLQEFLNNNGIIVAKTGPASAGKETTYFGNMTLKALAILQKKYNDKIKTTNFGVLDKATRDFINSLAKTSEVVAPKVVKTSLPSAVFTRNFGLDDKGEDVTRLQKLLASDKTLYPEGIISGVFGSITKKAVERFQLKYKITTSAHPAFGYIGPATRAKLKEIFGK
jgi:peptidoglycan hydrolase-like protein with peptidoglycan-binding domain